MRILHVEASPGWGGQEIRILREAEGMRERGHSLVFAVMRGAQLGVRARSAGFEVYEVNFYKLGWLVTLVRLLHVIYKYRIDVVNTHSSLDAWIGAIAARLLRRRVVRTRHLSTPVRAGLNSRILYKKLADYVVTTCEAIIPALSLQSGRPLEEFRSVATGVDVGGIRPDPALVARYRMGSFVVGTACFMRSWKGVEELLGAAELLRHERDLCWVIIGGGQVERYRKLAEEKRLLDIVHFTGHLDDPFAAIAALDVFALLSTANEGVSQAILQVAFLKRPLIATPTGGLPEVCLDRQTGILVPPFQPKAVASAVLELKGNVQLRETFGENAHELVNKRFTFKHTLDAMEETYTRVCAWTR